MKSPSTIEADELTFSELAASSHVELMVGIGILLEEQKFEKAYPLLKILLKRNPDDASYHLAAGKCAHSMGKGKWAFDHFTIAHELKPSAVTAQHLAEFLFIAGHHEQALAYSFFAFEKSTTAHLNAELQVLHAECLEALGHTEQAKEILTTCSGVHYGFPLVQAWSDRKDACLARVQNAEPKQITEIDIPLSFD